MSILVVGAHPDDETLGAGGLVARSVAEGREVAWLTFSGPTTSRGDDPDVAAGEWAEAGRRLGVTDLTQVGLADNRFDEVALLDLVTEVEAVIDRVRPTTVVTHHAGDVNVDHRLVAEAVLAATRPVPGHPVRTVLAFEVPSSTEWGFGAIRPFIPNLFVDISGVVDRKLDALGAYASELRTAPHPRSVEVVQALATVRGSAIGVAAAEAFQLVRSSW